MKPGEMISKEDFAQLLRDALNKLYDITSLGQHPLANILAIPEQAAVQRARKLRQLLIQYIEQLRPSPDIPAQSPDWRAYQILEKRFIEGMDTNEILHEMAISRAQFFRDQGRILDILTEQIWEQVEKHSQNQVLENLSDETQLLIRESQIEVLNLPDLLLEMEPMINAICANKGLSWSLDTGRGILQLPLNRVLFRQMFLSFLNAIPKPKKKAILRFQIFEESGEAGIRIVYPQEIIELEQESYRTAGSLGEHLRANIEQTENDNGSLFRIYWQRENKNRTLLLVDDNQDLVSLFERYLSESVWQLSSANSVAQAYAYLQTAHPDVIILDVMMPDTDGWDLLLQLRAQAETKAIPVIVCSAVQNRDLAIALGANAYLAKPVSADMLEQALRACLSN
jgi:CheY-like chemotaxis protein